MKQKLTIVSFYLILALEATGAPTQELLYHAEIAPKLTMVAMVDGKAFFLDRTTPRNRTQALLYCELWGMQLAEITSEDQFLALDRAVVDEWLERDAAWTGGIETSGILRYAWENSKVGLDPTYIPYQHRIDEEIKYFLVFRKYVNGSSLQNATPNDMTPATLCETLTEQQHTTTLSELVDL